MRRAPRILDLYCGAGGAGAGYHLAGFDVTGVDIDPQPRYPFDFMQADALAVLRDGLWRGFDAIHASPPCQRYSVATADPSRHPDLYAPTVELLAATGLPYIVENVIGAPYSSGVVLCGSMFGLAKDGEWLRRHRNFETSWLEMGPPRCQHPRGRRPITITGSAFTAVPRDVGRHSRQGPRELAEDLMGIHWMTRRELVESIPPAYTAYIGGSLRRILEAAA